MIKHAIRFYENNHDAHLIFHSTPNSLDYTWQWYVTDDKKSGGEIIEGQEHESFVTSTTWIQEESLEEKYLYCEYIHRMNGKKETTEFVQLFNDVDRIVSMNSAFDKVSSYDENGNIKNESDVKK